MTRPAGQPHSQSDAYSSPRDLPDGRSSTFDVRGWLAGLAKCSLDDVRHVRDHERNGRRTVTYTCNGVTAKVRMAPVAGAAAWELVADVPGAPDRVLLPAGTHFVWKARGTHT